MYNTSNNSFGKFEASIWPSATSFIMQSAYSGLFPSHNGTSDPDYFLKFEQKDALQVIVKREIVKVTARSGDIFTIVRWAWLCPASDTATTQTNTAFSFSAGDSISLTVVSEHIQQIEDDIATLQTTKANDSDVVKLTGTQTIAWVKTFSSSPIVPTPTTDFQPTTKKYVDDSIVSGSAPESLFEKDDYIAWETILANDSLFVESLPTFAESTVVQNIGDVTGNTRVSILWIGSGVVSNTLKLSLRKFVSPSANLSVRIETVSAWNPTGTLVDANAVLTIASANLTTSLKEYLTINSNISDSNWLTKPDTTSGNVWWAWFRIYTKERLELNSVTKNASTTATRAILKTDTWNIIIATATFSWNVATFASTIILDKNINYRIEVDNNWAWRTSKDNVFATPTYPVNLTNINYIWWSKWWSNYAKSPDIETINTSAIQDWSFPWTFTITKWQQVAIVLNQVWDVVNATNYYGVGYVARDTSTRKAKTWDGTVWSAGQNNRHYYTSSDLFENQLLSKADATYSYKLPTDYPRIATQGYSVGQSVTSKYFGLHNYPWLVANTAYYVANTPWAISAVAGSNPYVLGKTDGNWTLKINWKVLNKSITVSASPFSYTNTTGWPIQVSITGGTVNPIVINWVTTATATNHINTLPSWATMTVTYTVLPTITYSDL